MLNEVGISLGLRDTAIENTMTIDQIRLELHWAQRREARRMKIDQFAIGNGIGRALGGA